MLLGEPEQIQHYDFGLRGDTNKRTRSTHMHMRAHTQRDEANKTRYC